MESLLDRCGDAPLEAHYYTIEVLINLYQNKWTYDGTHWIPSLSYIRRELCRKIAPLFLTRAKYWYDEMRISPFQREIYDNRSKRLYEIGYHLLNYEYQTSLLHLAEAFFCS
jgi:hypothetical protein